jgi:hypothetical protein
LPAERKLQIAKPGLWLVTLGSLAAGGSHHPETNRFESVLAEALGFELRERVRGG